VPRRRTGWPPSRWPAVDYDLIRRNPAKGHRLPSKKRARSFLDNADHVVALLDAAGKLDRDGRVHPCRRALLAT
jgi:hypothetical protein